MMKIRNYLNTKAQGIVEYAVLLAFIVGLAMALNGSNLGGYVKNVFTYASDMLAYFNGGEFDIPAAIERISSLQSNYSGWTRGMIRSGWLNDSDSTLEEIQGIADELGATTWIYVNGKQSKDVKPNGLYWTTEDLSQVDWVSGTGDAQDYSAQSLLSYYYSPSDNTYYVIKNRVWCNQSDLSGATSLSAQYDWSGKYNGKPVAEIVGSASSYAEAKKIYNDTVTANGGSFVFEN